MLCTKSFHDGIRVFIGAVHEDWGAPASGDQLNQNVEDASEDKGISCNDVRDHYEKIPLSL